MGSIHKTYKQNYKTEKGEKNAKDETVQIV